MTSRTLLLAFAERTGLTSDAPPNRYLWTDAFAVCTFLGLGEQDLARRLIEQVHQVLGRRDGRWISGLSEEEGARHPTAGGLRIGKPLPERGPDEPYDPRAEWDRDGQYFHYLTRWAHALHQAGRDDHARELARAAHHAFVRDGRMAWKMSVDLSRPLVPSMGHHDPLDGLVTWLELGGLEPEVDQMERLCQGRAWATEDPLGIGGLLTDLSRLRQLDVRPDLQEQLVHDALSGLRAWARSRPLDLPASMRLGFREIGLAIGLHAVADDPAFRDHRPLAGEIGGFWLENRDARTWREHQDINDVMLAASLAPEGYLHLR